MPPCEKPISTVRLAVTPKLVCSRRTRSSTSGSTARHALAMVVAVQAARRVPVLRRAAARVGIEAARHHQRRARKARLELERDRDHRLRGRAAAVQEDEQVVRADALAWARSEKPGRKTCPLDCYPVDDAFCKLICIPSQVRHAKHWISKGFLGACRSPTGSPSSAARRSTLLAAVVGLALGAGLASRCSSTTWNNDFYNTLREQGPGGVLPPARQVRRCSRSSGSSSRSTACISSRCCRSSGAPGSPTTSSQDWMQDQALLPHAARSTAAPTTRTSASPRTCDIFVDIHADARARPALRGRHAGLVRRHPVGAVRRARAVAASTIPGYHGVGRRSSTPSSAPVLTHLIGRR